MAMGANERTAPVSRLRLLPWANDMGKPCYVASDSGSPLARLADEMERVQLAMGTEVLGHARTVLEDPLAGHAEIRYAGVRLAECLADALRVAESRGQRLPVPDSDEDEDAPTVPAEASA
ncbi:hypothetical protein [Streptomyces europaeiscabiei]|uniref:hypothetical protein n=1 Tax=Streptomyces europaeiscabiei TaxID=146819 RepID=UPI0029BDEC7F|nr:hypothetical protein [Streptomyces europaeiscabiei]MDX2771565.1 hypothetical protein [Streptomyces europaeiscabiei]